jgi:hypothetical protein
LYGPDVALLPSALLTFATTGCVALLKTLKLSREVGAATETESERTAQVEPAY